jgi:hypothetical protein
MKIIVFILACGLLAGSASAGSVLVQAADFTGDRTISAGELVGQGDYASDIKLSWAITELAGIFTYKWTLSGEDDGDLPQGVSHSLFQVSDDFTSNNILAGSDDVEDGMPKLFNPGPSNPDMPGSMFGIKFDFGSAEDAPVTYTLVTDKVPVWGNYYGKDGRTSGAPPKIENVVWNAGFLDDPMSVLDGDYSHWIPVPDSDTIIIPPGSIIPLPPAGWTGLVLLGLMGAGRRLRRRTSAA